MKKVKKISIVIIPIILLLASVNFYIENLRTETKMLCKELQETDVGKGIKLNTAIDIATEKGFEIDLTYKNNSHALIYKFYSHPGICIGNYKDGVLYNVKYIYHT